MIGSKMFWRLVVPALAIGILSLLASAILFKADQFPWLQDLGMNIAITAFGTLVTILYVDRVVQSHEERRWSGVAKFARRRIRRTATKSILAIRLALDIPPPSFLMGNFTTIDPGSLFRRGLQDQIETAQRISGSDLRKLGELSQASWEGFALNLANAREDAERIVELFGDRIGPLEQERLLLMHRQLGSLHHCWEMFDKPFIQAAAPLLAPTVKDYPSLTNPLILEAAIQMTDDLLKTVIAILVSPEYSSELVD